MNMKFNKVFNDDVNKLSTLTGKLRFIFIVELIISVFKSII